MGWNSAVKVCGNYYTRKNFTHHGKVVVYGTVLDLYEVVTVS